MKRSEQVSEEAEREVFGAVFFVQGMTVGDIVDVTGLSRSTVYKALNRLVAQEMVEKVRAGKGYPTSTMHYLRTPKGVA